MAFVLVQHLSPDHKSMLSELLGRTTAMPVVEATDGMALTADSVFIIPPDATLTISDGHLQVARPAPPRDRRRPIDTFFQSLAEDQGRNAIGIVLSGTGSDGTLGLAAIKEHGGLTLAQAEFDHHALPGMPQSATSTGQVDSVLPVEEMPAQLITYQQHLADIAKGAHGASPHQDMAMNLNTIIGALRARSGHDFHEYKEKTLLRRLQRRMQVVHAKTSGDYIEHYVQHPDELDMLFRELLIGVTQFFRDPAAFEALAASVLHGLIEAKQADDDIRIWVPGCATGQEALTIAILLGEAMDGRRVRPKVQIFGTDIDERAIAHARLGRYRAPVAGLSADRLDRWFTQEGSDWCVVPEIREMCVFSTHSIIKHPPFSKLDLVSCRNLLIYLDANMQDRVMHTFHYALKPGGLLFLGSSETVTRVSALFEVRDKKHRIFQRRDTDRPSLPDLSGISRRLESTIRPDTFRPARDSRLDQNARRVTEKYAPAHAVINDHDQVVRFSGAAMGRYVELAPGAPSIALFDILRKTLRPAARMALKHARATHTAVRQENVPVRIDGKPRLITIIAEPLTELGPEAGFVVVLFQDVTGNVTRVKAAGADKYPDDAFKALEQELRTTRAQLMATIDELEVANEELKSSNEEHQSVNEELQSSNEELETAKEEMQSVNEEVQTINSEMISKNEQLTHLNSDLKNLFDSTEIATLFLDGQLRVKSFTPGVTDIFHLRESDIGRPVTDIASLIDYIDLQHDVRSVLRKLNVVERQVTLKASGATFILRMRPYRTVDNVIDGVVLTFVDITERNVVDKALRVSEIQYRTLFESIDEGFCIIQKLETEPGAPSDFRYITVNPAFVVQSGLQGVVGGTIRDAVGGEADSLLAIYDRVALTGESVRCEYHLQVTSRDLELFAFRIEDGTHGHIGVIFANITERKRIAAALSESEQQFHALAESIPQLAWILDGDEGMVWFNRRWYEYTGGTLEEHKGWRWLSLQHPDQPEALDVGIRRALQSGEAWEDTFQLRGHDGIYRWFLSRAEPIRDHTGRIYRWFGTNTDIDVQRLAEVQRALMYRELNHRVMNLFAIVSAMMTLSVRAATTPQQLATTIRGRLAALATAHRLIIPQSESTSGIAEDADLSQLVKLVLAPHTDPLQAGGEVRALFEGPKVAISGEAITNLAMILHELATNAAKYGAFSVTTGRVRISWTLDGDRLRLIWEERGGPPIKASPEHEGFGSLLVRQSVGVHLGGESSFDCKPTGLVASFSFPTERLRS